MSYTSTEVKRRYNESVYTKFKFYIPIETKDKFKERCETYGTSMRKVIIGIMEGYINEKHISRSNK